MNAAKGRKTSRPELESQPTPESLLHEPTPASRPGDPFEERILPPGLQIAGRYRILEVLGVGGMGVVYRAHDDRLDRELALKVLRPEITRDAGFVTRFRDKLALARKLSHRHVVTIHDDGVHEGMHFVTMDLVAGRPLDELLRDKGELPSNQALAIFRQVAGALAEAHRQGIVHGGLKLADILLDAGGDAHVTDLGIARPLGSRPVRTGTPGLLPSERTRGEKVDDRGDIFALGLIFIQLASGKVLFPGSGPLETGDLCVDELGLELPDEVSKIIERCLEKDPDKRYPTAELLVEALAASDRPPARRGLSIRAAAGTAAALSAIAVAAYFLGREAVSPGTGGAEGPSAGAETAGPPAARLPAPAPRHSLAVLPFTEATGSSGMAWAAYGVADMLARGLAENEHLRVVDSVRVFQVLQDLGLRAGEPSQEDLARIAELLRVDRLVSGQLGAGEGEIQLATSLIEAGLQGSPSRVIDTRHCEVRELFELVDAIAGRLWEALEVSAGHGPRPVPPTRSEAAVRAYAEGLEHLSTRESSRAVPALEQAVAEDPAFAAAWVVLSRVYQSLGRDDQALAAAREAVAASRGAGGRTLGEARAREALLAGRHEEARESLEDLVRSYPNDTGARVILAESYGREGSFARAISLLKEVVAVDPSPRALYLLGRFSIESGDPRSAVDDYLVEALAEQKKLENRRGEAEVLNALGAGYERLGELGRAAESYGAAAAAYRRIGDDPGLAASLHHLAVIRFIEGDFEGSRENMETALAIQKEEGNVAGVAELYDLEGAIEEKLGHYPEALAAYRRALNDRNALGDERALAESHFNVGDTYRLLDDYDNAFLHLQRALELHRKNDGRHGITLALLSIGICKRARGAWPDAADSFAEALELSRKTGDKLAASAALGNLGRIAQYQGRYSAALSSYAEARVMRTEMRDLQGQVELVLHEAETLLELGLEGRAELELERIAKLVADGTPAERAAWQALRGEVLLRRGEIAAAARLVAAAAAEAEASRRAVGEIGVRIVSGRVAMAADRLDTALAELRRAHSEAVRLDNAILQLRAAEALARAEILSENVDAAEDVLEAALRTSTSGGAYARAYRLHHLFAQVLGKKGDARASADSMEAAREEVARVRQDLGDELRRSFDGLPEVQELL